MSNHNGFRECRLIKRLPYILFEKYIYILASETASLGNQHCANSIGTLAVPILNPNRRLALTRCRPDGSETICLVLFGQFR